MKPARSPRFQSEALRSSIARISACGSPSPAQAATAKTTTHHPSRTDRPLHGMAGNGPGCRALTPRRGAGAPLLEPSERRSRKVPSGSLLATTLLRRLPLRAPRAPRAPLRLRLGPLLAALFRLGPLRRFPLLLRRPGGRRRRLLPHRRGSRQRRGRRVHRLHHARAGPTALREIGWLEHRVSSAGSPWAWPIAYRGNAATQVITRCLTPALCLLPTLAGAQAAPRPISLPWREFGIELAGPAQPDGYPSAVGRRAVLIGTATGAFEAWAWPLKLLHGFELRFKKPVATSHGASKSRPPEPRSSTPTLRS